MVHLKDFSLLSPNIQSGEIFKAIETAIPTEAIEQAIAKTQAQEERNRSLPNSRASTNRRYRQPPTGLTSTIGYLLDNCNESLVKRFDAGCTQELN